MMLNHTPSLLANFSHNQQSRCEIDLYGTVIETANLVHTPDKALDVREGVADGLLGGEARPESLDGCLDPFCLDEAGPLTASALERYSFTANSTPNPGSMIAQAEKSCGLSATNKRAQLNFNEPK